MYVAKMDKEPFIKQLSTYYERLENLVKWDHFQKKTITLLMAISGYSIGGYWCLLLIIILMDINGYYIDGYWWLLVVIILMIIVNSSIVILQWNNFTRVKLVKCNELISLLRSHSKLHLTYVVVITPTFCNNCGKGFGIKWTWLVGHGSIPSWLSIEGKGGRGGGFYDFSKFWNLATFENWMVQTLHQNVTFMIKSKYV